eukprot:maker-scaffold1054_size66621-snap-gene-0.11 protein:Tk00478 transcript:maker-scaffold1054_size66621-snap-gene-0.11-mRNA-1 annotation:"spt transcription factor family member"
MISLNPRGPATAVLLLALVGLHSTHIHADAEADAQADPLPEAMPEADAQYPYQMPPQSMVPPMMPYNPVQRPPMSPCQMTNQCCGMANEKCCVGGERCYTVFERKCEQEDNPECAMSFEKVCSDATMPSCRLVPEVVTEDFVASVCSPRPMKKCWTYEKKVCAPDTKPGVKNIQWANDKLAVYEQDEKQHCVNQTSYKCEDKVVLETTTNQVKRQRVLPDSRRQCTRVPVMGNSSTIVVPVSRIVYRQQCYDMPVPQCSTSACGTGFCGQGTSVCSRSQFNTQTVCPSAPGAMGGMQGSNQNCQTVREPLCYGSNQPCNAGSQQCCNSESQRVCRQVPQRITEQVSQTIPGQVSYNTVCQDIAFNRTEIYYEPVQQVFNKTKNDCMQIQKRQCFNMTIPKYRVTQVPNSESITVQLPNCRHRLVSDQFCHTFPTGEIECRKTTIRKRFRINKIKCDQLTQTPICQQFPKMDCRLGSRVKCEMVPKKVCQDKCSNSPLCNQCNQFVQQGPGFGSCASSTCGTLVPNNPWLGGGASNGIGGVIQYPGDEVYPGGDIGGGSYYPGSEIGGENVYPGGDSYYPGNGIGGSDSYPGMGEMYPYPDQDIGGGMIYPGEVGGGESFPGNSYPPYGNQGVTGDDDLDLSSLVSEAGQDASDN